jgi:hypothetical protein
LEPVGVCVDIVRPLCRQSLEASRSPRGENSWSGGSGGRKQLFGGRSRTGRPCDFLEIESSQIGRHATSKAVDAGGEKPGRVGVSPASHFSREFPLPLGRRAGPTSGVIHSVLQRSSVRSARSGRPHLRARSLYRPKRCARRAS